MKKIDHSQMIMVRANVGVIAGILSLGFKLRQRRRRDTIMKFHIAAIIMAAVCLPLMVSAQTPEGTAIVPEAVLTPDIIETESIGTLEFFDGMPTHDTVEKVYDFIDLARGVDAFLNGIPATSLYSLLRGLREAGVQPLEIAIFQELMDANTLYLTPNTTTMYVLSQLDLSNGPVVAEIPPGVLGFLDDAYFRYVVDFGVLGPDRGDGGNYLILPPGYDGDIPEGYFVVRSTTFDHWFLLRGFVENGDLEAAADNIREHARLYPLSQANDPPEQVFHNHSGLRYNTVHANNFEFYEELNAVIQKEPADAFNPELVGIFAAIGIQKGEPFEPDARMKRILTEAAAIANATARAISYSPRSEGVFLYEDRYWTSPFAGGSHEFIDNGARMLDQRVFFHYIATGITPAMARSAVGQGSAYALTAKDIDNNYLDGGKTYKIDLPSPVPADDFWSFMVYSGQHRSMLETDQRSAGVDSLSESNVANDDGSYTIWFGPEAPEGREGNWVQTIPGKSFNVMFRLYGPLEPWFDKTWKLGDFELVE